MAGKVDAKTLASRFVELGIATPKKPLKEQGYPNLVLCIVDAVFATQPRVGSAQGPVRSLHAYWQAKALKPRAWAARLTVSDFVANVGHLTDAQLTKKVFADARAATGAPERPRARVAIDLARNLAERGIERKADLRDPEKAAAVNEAVRATKGFGSAGAAYLRALASDAPVTDAMVAGFVAEALGRDVEPAEARDILAAAAKRLSKKVAGLTLADVEQFVWRQAFGYAKG